MHTLWKPRTAAWYMDEVKLHFKMIKSRQNIMATNFMLQNTHQTLEKTYININSVYQFHVIYKILLLIGVIN